jgi:predicted secreted acid phosphatase
VEGGEPVVSTPSKKKAVIVDMDGTLVDVSAIRHYVTATLKEDGSYDEHKDFDAFHKASVLCPAHHDVIDRVEYYWQQKCDILIVTARSEQYARTTRDWLYKYAVPYTKIYMRSVGDFRSDVDVKRDMLEEIQQEWDIKHALDDNPSVVALWRENGIPVTVIPGWED